MREQPKERLVEEGIWEKRGGGYIARVSVGSGDDRLTWSDHFSDDTSIKVIRAERATALAKLRKQQAQPVDRFSLKVAADEYIRVAKITPDTRKARRQQLDWWCAQPVAVGADVLSPAQVKAETEARERGEDVPDRGPTFGSVGRARLGDHLQRLCEILDQAFAPTDLARDPYEFASTSNHYRLALSHLFNELDKLKPEAINPIENIPMRAQRGPQEKGQDMRIVREILAHGGKTKFGPKDAVTPLRLAVLAYVHITPTQLMELELTDFHDVPDATPEEILDGIITITKQPRRKGRKDKPLPAPETIPVNTYGVEALRAYAQYPDAWGKEFSLPSANKTFKRWCRLTQAALADRGVKVDLSRMTVYHLKHSLATAATMASAGLMDQTGKIRQDEGVVKALDHANSRTTRIYTQASVSPLVRRVNRMTSQWLEVLFMHPLDNRPSPLRLVATGTTGN